MQETLQIQSAGQCYYFMADGSTTLIINSCNFYMKHVAKNCNLLRNKKIYTQMHVKWLRIIPCILQDFWILFILWGEIFTLIKHHALILIIAYTASYIFLNFNSNCRREKTSTKQPVIQSVDWHLNRPELFPFDPLHFYDKTKQVTNFVVQRKIYKGVCQFLPL